MGRGPSRPFRGDRRRARGRPAIRRGCRGPRVVPRKARSVLVSAGWFELKVLVLPGDGIGPEVARPAAAVLVAAATRGHEFVLTEAPIGGAGIAAAGDPLPEATAHLAEQSDAILFGAAGIAGDTLLPAARRPGAGLLRLRKRLGLFANYRPAVLYPELIDASSLKPEIVRGLDLMILRELNGDAYFGEPRGVSVDAGGERIGVNTMRYSESEIRRIAHAGFRLARKRTRKLCSVDKANVLEVMKLWREVVTEVGREYPDVALTHLFVDAAAMHLLRRPTDFDVIVTGNMFGDILSDEAAMLTGSIGMLPSASLGEGRRGLYEPVHGSAPDIAGRDIANPLGAILSSAMLLRLSADDEAGATRIEAAVREVLARGLRTADIHTPGTTLVGTAAMGAAVLAAL
ncbi:MAG: 3-isopropylmalate dehydrogenase [Burkholderiales bacterium]|nr:3-isopropylmalate dehydrogenase [Burkholderiales bacterium]